MFNNGSTSLKKYKRLNVYKNSTGTVQYNPETKQARSYAWVFAAEINGKMVVNDYKWSVTTSCHQTTIRSLFRQLGKEYISADFGSTAIPNLSKNDVIKLLKDAYNAQIDGELTLKKESYAYQSRIYKMQRSLETVALLESLDPKRFKISEKEKVTIYNEVIETRMTDLMDKEAEKCFKYLSLKAAAENVESITL